jgi:hypothetical protein
MAFREVDLVCKYCGRVVYLVSGIPDSRTLPSSPSSCEEQGLGKCDAQTRAEAQESQSGPE